MDRTDAFNILLDHGAQLNAQDTSDYAEIHLVAHANNKTLMKRLLAEETVDLPLTTLNGRTALHSAAEAGNLTFACS